MLLQHSGVLDFKVVDWCLTSSMETVFHVSLPTVSIGVRAAGSKHGAALFDGGSPQGKTFLW